MIAARCCGAAERLIELARSWSLERSASGKKISQYQAIQFMLADSVTELNAARLMTYQVAQSWDRDDPSVLHGKTAMAKLYASEMAGRVADRAVQIFGGRGYMTENPAKVLPGAPRGPHLGGHERDSAPDNRPRDAQAGRRRVLDGRLTTRQERPQQHQREEKVWTSRSHA